MRKILTAAAFGLLAAPASALTILEYQTAPSTTFTTLGASLASVAEMTNDMVAGEGITEATGGTWNWRAWGDGTTAFETAEEALRGEDFWFWGFSGATAYDLTSFDIRLDRSSTGPNQFELDLSVNGGDYATVLSDDFGDSSSGRDYIGVDLSNFDAVTSAVFRLVAFGADSGGISASGTFDLETVDFFGDDPRSFRLEGELSDAPAPIPLPAGLPLLAAAVGALGLLRRKG